MFTQKELQTIIEKILQKTQDPEQISAEITRVNEIHHQILVTENKIRKLDEKYKTDLKLINDEIQKTMKECPHYLYTFHGDPSGGNDSFYSCTICGYEW